MVIKNYSSSTIQLGLAGHCLVRIALWKRLVDKTPFEKYVWASKKEKLAVLRNEAPVFLENYEVLYLNARSIQRLKDISCLEQEG